jgi:hypothetical protein
MLGFFVARSWWLPSIIEPHTDALAGAFHPVMTTDKYVIAFTNNSPGTAPLK